MTPGSPADRRPVIFQPSGGGFRMFPAATSEGLRGPFFPDRSRSIDFGDGGGGRRSCVVRFRLEVRIEMPDRDLYSGLTAGRPWGAVHDPDRRARLADGRHLNAHDGGVDVGRRSPSRSSSSRRSRSWSRCRKGLPLTDGCGGTRPPRRPGSCRVRVAEPTDVHACREPMPDDDVDDIDDIRTWR